MCCAARCLDLYIAARTAPAENDSAPQIDPRLTAIVERMFERRVFRPAPLSKLVQHLLFACSAERPATLLAFPVSLEHGLVTGAYMMASMSKPSALRLK